MAPRHVAIALAITATLLAAMFGWQAYQAWEGLRQPVPASTPRTELLGIQSWMTVRYIARADNVPRAELAARLGAPPSGDITLAELARRRRVRPSQEVAEAHQAVAELLPAPPGASPLAPTPVPR